MTAHSGPEYRLLVFRHKVPLHEEKHKVAVPEKLAETEIEELFVGGYYCGEILIAWLGPCGLRGSFPGMEFAY